MVALIFYLGNLRENLERRSREEKQAAILNAASDTHTRSLPMVRCSSLSCFLWSFYLDSIVGCALVATALPSTARYKVWLDRNQGREGAQQEESGVCLMQFLI